MSMILDNRVHCPLVGSSLLVYHLVPSVDTKSFNTLLKINQQRRRTILRSLAGLFSSVIAYGSNPAGVLLGIGRLKRLN
jgi:hypothetical protein